jgi:mono/diheme cytochrome c family protein
MTHRAAPGESAKRVAPLKWTLPPLLAILLLATDMRAGSGPSNSGETLLREQRHSSTDLEVVTQTAPGPHSATHFIAYEDLLKLPQVTYTISDDSNFAPATRIGGVRMEALAKLLSHDPNADVIVAICNDKYRATYPREYLAAHHPVLVLTVNGKSPAQWPKSHDQGPMGPYLISHPTFTPAFHILSHTDEAQIPYGVVRLEFRSHAGVFGAIRPRGSYASDSLVTQGYRIAQQNCYRCHNMGEEGGQMARHPWPVLAAWAASDPKYFAVYVRNPKSVGADRMMPAMTQYDDKTIDALRAYFATFAVAPPAKGPAR